MPEDMISLRTFVEKTPVTVLAVSDGAVIGLFDGFSVSIGASLGGVSRGRRRVKPLRGSFASLEPTRVGKGPETPDRITCES